jgi:hypothetical protein
MYIYDFIVNLLGLPNDAFPCLHSSHAILSSSNADSTNAPRLRDVSLAFDKALLQLF